MEYLQWLGGEAASPRQSLAAAWSACTAWETLLAGRLIEGLHAIDGIAIYGITNPNRLAERVPTVSFTHARVAPATIARALEAQGICVWSGNNYALELVRRLGLPEACGVLCIGLAHYNTHEP